MLQSGKWLFWLLAVALVGTLLATFERLPPVVASHFDGAGVPNGWSSRPGYALLLFTLGILLPLGIIVLVHAVTRSGPGQLNIPARAYWTRPDHSAEAVRRVRAYMWWLGSVLAGTALLMHALVLAAHRSEPPHLHTDLVVMVIGAVLLGVGAWAAGWYRLLRAPEAH